MSRFKLANVVTDAGGDEKTTPLLYDGDAALDVESGALVVRGEVDFLTYLNALSACKWRRYAGLTKALLHLELSGSGEVVVRAVATGADVPREMSRQRFNGPCEIDIPLDLEGEDLMGFSLVSHEGSEVRLARGWYAAEVDEDALNHVRIAVSTTTFRNERYILPNIQSVKQGIAREGGALADNFHMFVVDNGRSLDAASLTDDVITVIPNPNVGGSGGFARGMMAATEHEGEFTHVILMDDDVRILPESFVRTFALLSLAKGRYRDAFVNGAMLSLENPTRQFEDVAHVIKSAAYCRLKSDLFVDRLSDVLENERADVEVENAYGAWWYSCIPVAVIKRNGLPVPFFVRCDDVEFGMRNKPVYMTMGGVCVWHASFEGRYRPSVDCYQYTRNFLAMIAMDDCASERAFMLRFRRSMRLSLRDLDYVSAEFFLQGLEDYLKGPDFLARADGSALMKENGARNERVADVSELDSDVLAQAGVTPEVLSNKSLDFRGSRLRSLVRTLPYDKHYLPEGMVRGRVGYVVKNAGTVLEGHATGCETIVYLDATREHGAIRRMDRARFKEIRRREARVMREYRRRGSEVRAAWKAALPRFASREFWERYLAERA
ncbi:hypothetical protein [Thermophilibacter sp.]